MVNQIGGVIINLKILKGENLAPKDRNWRNQAYSSDPYVIIFRKGKELSRTRTIKKSLDPVWNEAFRFHIGADEGIEQCMALSN